MSGKSLMTQYVEGTLVSRELRDMLNDYAAEARFDRDMHDDVDLYGDTDKPYGRKRVLIHKGNPKTED